MGMIPSIFLFLASFVLNILADHVSESFDLRTKVLKMSSRQKNLEKRLLAKFSVY